jgi:hypothetical protein
MQKSYPLILPIHCTHFAIFPSKEKKDGYIETEGYESTSMVWLSKALVNAHIISFNSKQETYLPLVVLEPLSLSVWVFGPVIVSTKQRQKATNKHYELYNYTQGGAGHTSYESVLPCSYKFLTSTTSVKQCLV